MILGNKNPDQLTEADLQSLIDDGVSEGREVDYKLALHGNTDKDKKEFLADVSSFANTDGGYLIFGVKCKKENDSSIPESIEGVEVANIDDEKQRLNSTAQSGIEPILHGLQIEAIPLTNGKHVIAVRIPRSWIPPHMVKYKGTQRFYSRHYSGKFPMDVTEIKRVVLQSDLLIDRIRKFRIERIELIESGRTPYPLASGPKCIVHIIPFLSLDQTRHFELRPYQPPHLGLSLIGDTGWNWNINFDGEYFGSGNRSDTAQRGYVQFFRNGIIESTICLHKVSDDSFAWSYYEGKIVRSISDYLSTLKKVGIEPPLGLIITIIGVQDLTINSFDNYDMEYKPIDRNELPLPELVINSWDIDIPNELRTRFDSIWNACNQLHSPNYDEAGNWAPHS
ncbi:ATP-binding protein [bacterium]|nr:ATP-binding protein [bacterium]